MSRRFIVFVAFFALAVGFVTRVCASVPAGYVTDGLVACWDAIDNQATGVHDGSATTWVDLVEGRAFVLNKTVWSADYLTFDGTANCGGTLAAADASVFAFDAVVTNRTVEIVFKYAKSGTSGIVLMGSTASRLAVGRNSTYGINSTAGSDNLVKGVLPIIGTEAVTLSYGYKNGKPVTGYLYHELAEGTCTGPNDAWYYPDGNVYLGRRANNISSFVGSICAVRVYDRLLTAEEVRTNTMADTARFSLKRGALVVSGSVTIGGVTYDAGKAIPYSGAGAVTIDAATEATVALSANVTSVTLTGGSLALANGDAVLKTLGDLTLGADARLKLTGNGLQVTGTVTADASAAVVGPGIFVAKEDATPVALEGGATYLSSRGTFAGWPTSGIAYLPVGTVAMIATEEDVTKVAGLDGIVFLDDGTETAQTSTVTYSSSADLTLSARLQGKGTFDSEDAGTLTLSGDNSGLTAPGHISANGTAIVVDHPNGLGSRETGAATLTATDATAAKAIITFNVNEAGVFTNEVKLTVGREKYKFVANPITGRIVQHNDFYKTVSGQICPGGTFEFYGCQVRSENYLYAGPAYEGEPSHLWLSEDCTYRLSYLMFFNNEDTQIHFNGASLFNANPCFVNGICEKEGVLKDCYVAAWQKYTTLDLNGFDQKTKGFDNAQVGGGKDYTRVITSATPATLTTTANADIYHWPKFEGEVSYCHDNTGIETIAKYVSSSTNLLDVAKGKVILEDGAGWSGDVTVRTGAVLELSSAKAIQGGNRRLTVEAGGSLVLKSGAQCYVASANIAGTELESGMIYTVAMLRDTMGLPVDGDDAAALTVKDTGEWKGWPSSGTAKVPTDTTVYIGDDDVANVNALDGIALMPGSSVICTNVENGLALRAKISGSGSFVAANAAPIVLLGDNSGLQAPGTFYFTNTYVVVSNRYGLGSVGTAAVRYSPGSDMLDDLSLRFGGPGLVCDVPIRFGVGETEGVAGVIGPDSPDETLILSNSFTIVGWRPKICFKNNIRFSGGTFTVVGTGDGNNFLYSNKKGDYKPQVWFDAEAKPSAVMWFAADCVYHLGWKAASAYFGLFVLYTGGATAICEAEDAMGVPIDITHAGIGYYDLNGYDQEVQNLSKQYNAEANNPFVITSAVPAVVRRTKPGTTDDNKNQPMRFLGAAGYAHAAAYTNDFFKYFSDTTGPLTVEQGALRFRDNAGWGGTNVTVKAGARLILADTAAEQPFVRASTRVETALTVEEGGKIDIDLTEKPVKVRSFTYAGAPLERGVYTKANCAAIEGEGSVKVLGHPGLILIVR